MRPGRAWAGLALALFAAAAALAFAVGLGPEQPRRLEDRVQAVAETLRCPVCQNLSVADSPSPLANEMRRTIARRLRAGDSPDQIRAEFVAAYGEWILQEPPARGINLVAWAAPAVLLLAGLVTVSVAIRRWTSSAGASPGGADPPLSPADRRLLDRALATPDEESR